MKSNHFGVEHGFSKQPVKMWEIPLPSLQDFRRKSLYLGYNTSFPVNVPLNPSICLLAYVLWCFFSWYLRSAMESVFFSWYLRSAMESITALDSRKRCAKPFNILQCNHIIKRNKSPEKNMNIVVSRKLHATRERWCPPVLRVSLWQLCCALS